MTDRVCVRGCTVRDVHYATCPDFGKTGETECRGCAPRECRAGSLICDKCFGRMRGLLADVPDLLGRLRAIADPTKATPLDQVRVAASSTEPPAPVGSDLLDAIHAVELAADWCWADLTAASNDLDTVTWLGTILLDRHPEVNGERPAWSVQDAVDRWGVERRDRSGYVYPEDDGEDVQLGPVREWYDTLLTLDEAAERVHVTARQVRRWVKDEELKVSARLRGPRGQVVTYVHASVVDATAKRMQAKQAATRFTPAESAVCPR